MTQPKIVVRHLRTYTVHVPPHDGTPAGAAKALRDARVLVNPHGGTTVAVAITPEHVEIVTRTARCRADEPYRKAFGRRIATARALKAYNRLARHTR